MLRHHLPAGLCCLLLVSFLVEIWAKCPNWCSQHGICTGPNDDAICICEMGYEGADCGTRLCPKGDDPLTKSQVSRAIRITTTAVTGELGGKWTFTFDGESVEFGADASLVDGPACARLVAELPNVESATCERGAIDDHKGASYTVSFDAWPLRPWQNNVFSHNGNPSLSSFSCSMDQVEGGSYNPGCFISDVAGGSGQDEFVVEYAECSQHGTCDRESAICRCNLGFKGDACDDITDANDIAVHIAEGPFFSASVLKLRAGRSPSSEFSLLQAVAGTSTLFDLQGTGDLEVAGRVRGRTLSAESMSLGGTGPDAVRDRTSPEPVLEILSGSQAGPALHVTLTGAEAGLNSVDNLLVLSSVDGDAPFMSVGSGGAVFRGPAGLSVEGGGGLSVLDGGITAVTGPLSVGREGAEIGGSVSIGVDFSSPAQELGERSGALAVSASHLGHEGQAALSLSLSSPESSDALLLSASVDGEDKLSVHASGRTVVHAGGLAVESGGLLVETGGLAVEAGGLQVEGGITLLSGTLNLKGDLGLEVGGGGLRAVGTSHSYAPLEAVAAAENFEGSVGVFKVNAAPESLSEAQKFKLLEGVVGDQTVFSVAGSGNVLASGVLHAEGGLETDGHIDAGGRAVLRLKEVRAGPTVTISAQGPSVWRIVSDEAVDENVLEVVGEARAGQLLIVINGDHQATSGPVAQVPPGYAVMLIYTGAAWVDLGALRTHATELAGVTKFEAGADLNVGDIAFTAGHLVSSSSTEGHVAIYGGGGALQGSDSLRFDREKGALFVSRLSVGQMASGLDFRGLTASNVALMNVTVDSLPYLLAEKITLGSAALSVVERTQPAGAEPRFASFDDMGRLSPVSRSIAGFVDGSLKAQSIVASELKVTSLKGSIDGGGHVLHNVTLRQVGELEVQLLDVEGELILRSVMDSSPEGALLMQGRNGSVVASADSPRVDEGGQLIIGARGLRLDGPLDFNHATLHNLNIPEEIISSAIQVALEREGLSDGASVRTGELGGDEGEARPLRSLAAHDLHLQGELRLSSREGDRGSLIAFGAGGGLTSAATFSDTLSIECAVLTANRVRASSLETSGSLKAGEAIFEELRTTGRFRASSIALEGELEGNGNIVSDVMLDRVRSLNVSGELRLDGLTPTSGEGAHSILVLKPGGAVGKAPGLAVDASTGELRAALMTGHAMSGDIKMQGHMIDMQGGAVKGLDSLSVAGDLSADGDALVGGSLSVGGSVMGGGPYMDTSDMRLKRSVADIGSAEGLAAVRQLRGVRYEFLSDLVRQQPDLEGVHIGLLAQEVLNVAPETVAAKEDGFLAVSYSGLVPLLIEGVKQLALDNERLEKTLSEMERRMEALEVALRERA
jgi:hypothetical protein